VSSPHALTEINIAFSKSLDEKKCDSSLFDSLSTLLAHEKVHIIIQFTHNVITKVKVSNCKAVFIALKEDVNSELIKDLYMFVDKVVELSG
jgi:N-acetyl-gamma-glutamylphosphate reductase